MLDNVLNANPQSLAALADLINSVLPPPKPILEEILSCPVQAVDPNDKFGPAGTGAARHVPGASPLSYAVAFENKPDATAAAQEVVIADQLDVSKFDLGTFALGPFAFGDQRVEPPAGLKQFSVDVDLRPANNLIVRVNAGLDVATGLVTWRFISLDPATMLPTEDALAGFLPPNKTPPEGEGSVFFTVSPKPGLATGTQIRNKASIVFDTNAPIETPEWLNTIDASAPTSQVLPLAATQPTPSFQVQWSGTDQGAGVQDYTVFVAEDGGPYTIWQANTTATSAVFTGLSGKSYAFYSLARDAVGNREDAPAAPDAVTRVAAADTTPPETRSAITPLPNAAGWHNGPVSAALTAADPPGSDGAPASGVKEITYCVSGPAPGVGPVCTTVPGAAATVAVTAEGTTLLTYSAADNAGNREGQRSLTLKIDATPPATAATPNQAPNPQGWHRTAVAVSLAATDSLSGVVHTEYDLDGAGWKPYLRPIAIGADGVHTLTYRSTDAAGNTEAVRTLVVRIDATAPEAQVRFDPATGRIQVYGTDQNLATPAGPVAPRPISTTGAGGATRESATYEITDLAGNALMLVLELRRAGQTQTAKIVGLRANGGPETIPPENSLMVVPAPERDSGLGNLQQHATVGSGGDRRTVTASYNAVQGRTLVITAGPGGGAPATVPGLALVSLVTRRGAVAINLGQGATAALAPVSPTGAETLSPSPTPTASAASATVPTATPVPSATQTRTVTATATPSATASATHTPTATPIPTFTATASPIIASPTPPGLPPAQPAAASSATP